MTLLGLQGQQSRQSSAEKLLGTPRAQAAGGSPSPTFRVPEPSPMRTPNVPPHCAMVGARIGLHLIGGDALCKVGMAAT